MLKPKKTQLYFMEFQDLVHLIIKTMKKRWKKQLDHPLLVDTLSEKLALAPFLASLLIQRGVTTVAAAANFLTPSLDHLHNPFLMQDMDCAVERLDQAVQKQEKIMLYGDYDVDGTTSVAMMHQFLSQYTNQLSTYIPNRYREGYGVSIEGINSAVANGVQLIIAMDCGIKAVKAVAYAKQKGIDFIICDHHLPGTDLPAATAVLDPMRSDCSYPYKKLCGCGVSFKLVQAFTSHRKDSPKRWYDLLDLVAIATACDIVPVTGENRTLLWAGLQQVNQAPRIGLQPILAIRKKENNLTVSDLVFGVGPVINAAGRLGDAIAAVHLLLEKEDQKATAQASLLIHQNEERKCIDQQILFEAQEKWEAIPDHEERSSIVLFDEGWHRGVIGIVASRMVEKYQRPVILLTKSGGQLVGSARSVGKYNIYNAIQSCADLLDSFGGHQFAAGLSFPIERLANFKERFENTVQRTIQPLDCSPVIPVAAMLASDQLCLGVWEQVQQLAPFGPGNRNPVFVTKNLMDAGGTHLLKNNHLKLKVVSADGELIEGIGFGLGSYFPQAFEQHFNLCYTLEKNTWRGKSSLQLNVKDVKIAVRDEAHAL